MTTQEKAGHRGKTQRLWGGVQAAAPRQAWRWLVRVGVGVGIGVGVASVMGFVGSVRMVMGAAPTTPIDTPGNTVAIDMTKTPFSVSGGVRAFRPETPDRGTMDVRLRGSMLGPPDKQGELLFDLRRTPLHRVPWGNRTHVSAEVRVAPAFVGEGKRNWYRAHRARVFVVDARGRRLYLPNASIVDRPARTDGWLSLSGRPSADVPAPLGFMDAGFDANKVARVGVNVEAFNREGERVEGPIEVRNLRVTFETPVVSRVLPPDDAIIADEPARAARMQRRLTERTGAGATGMAVGVNLAWPTARAPSGEDLQLYGRILDGGTPWFDKLWDMGEPAVHASVQKDFQEIRAAFGKGAVIRVWLFADLRAGMAMDAQGLPTGATPRARANMRVLLDLAAAEGVVLVPVLLDFGLADGITQTGPNGAWQVVDRPDLITDADKRVHLVRALREFVKAFAGDPAILAWDVMNEPENAVALNTPAHFADLQIFLRQLVDAVHECGDLATVGYHNVDDPKRFFRGRVASDLGQVHYYPFVETRANPTPFAVKLASTFGPVPAGWGELQARPGRIAAQLAAAQRSGHRLFWFWSWRGHQETGDGFAVQPHAEEIKRALAGLPGRAR